jgi:hypothetical protein
MANKQVLSVVAASILAASMTFTGCGSSSSSSKPVVSSSSSMGTSSSNTTSSAGTSSSSSSDSNGSVSSSSAPTMTSVVVSDAYIINATVKVGDTALIAAGAGTYESAEVLTGAITVTDGVNDLNANGMVDSSDGNNSDYDVVAVKMQAPAGYENVNPFTTLNVMGMKNMATTFPTAAAIDAGYDFDVVANTTLDLAKEVLIAALTVQANTPTNAAASRILPEPGEVTVTSSSEAPASSVAASSEGGFLPEPGDSFKYVSQATIDAINAMTSMDEINAAFRAHFAAAATTASTSSDGGFLPEPGTPGSSSQAAVSSSTAATSSTGGGFLPEVD